MGVDGAVDVWYDYRAQEKRSAMDMTNEEIGKINLPAIWKQEHRDGVREMLRNEDDSLKQLAYALVDQWSGFRDWQGGDMTVGKTGRDRYGTFVFGVYGGRNWSLCANAPYYFNQIASMMLYARNMGVDVWPLDIKFDVEDDLWSAEFGIAFNLDDDCKAWLLNAAKRLDLVKEEAEPTEPVVRDPREESVPENEHLGDSKRNIQTGEVILKIANNEELEQKIKAALPENWEFDRISDACDAKYAPGFRVKCPVEDRMGDAESYHAKVDQICRATNSICDGGGWAIGGSKYDIFFYVRSD